eukprot:CAMPEP_0179319074 /NCGR_PEP_ID=MMETSP0797-20121207/57276_1 /TAXON_ID=47934 /ORGANISM="Dinophysis acuminata, Strain DAEP01" /LENGTH=60 /DNA_ID=CAMNT_0021030391 /DNA_START=39 /DNA_END=219 /DNA_ORIENTATION=+
MRVAPPSSRVLAVRRRAVKAGAPSVMSGRARLEGLEIRHLQGGADLHVRLGPGDDPEDAG